MHSSEPQSPREKYVSNIAEIAPHPLIERYISPNLIFKATAPAESVERRLAAMLVADVVGYSRLIVTILRRIVELAPAFMAAFWDRKQSNL